MSVADRDPASPVSPSLAGPDLDELAADEPLDGDLLTANGVNGSTGTYLLPPLSVAELAELAGAEAAPDPEHAADLRYRAEATNARYAVRIGVDERDLAEAGWGVIFAQDADPAVREALQPLLEHRQAQAARLKEHRYRELSGPAGYRPGETKNEFITRHGSAPGPVDPDRLPYYLLIVGDPETIPFSFQAQLDVAHAVGRIHFDTLDEYAQYARSVVQAETSGTPRPRRAHFVGVRNLGDQATALSARYLVSPLAQRIAATRPGWDVQLVDGPAASKARLLALLGGPETPAVLFTASHGVGFARGDPHQLADQGALLCGDWPGPLGWPAGQPLVPDHYLAARDVPSDASLHGLIAFHFACYGAGTPRYDEFAHRRPSSLGPNGSGPSEIAPHAFLAGLPKRLLGHPAGGALAVVGHVERAWGCSFLWGGRRLEQIAAFEEALALLLDGYPVGAALEALNQRYAECASDLSALLERRSYNLPVDVPTLVSAWTASNDARGYAIVGDPGARLAAAPPATEPARSGEIGATDSAGSGVAGSIGSGAVGSTESGEAAPWRIVTPPDEDGAPALSGDVASGGDLEASSGASDGRGTDAVYALLDEPGQARLRSRLGAAIERLGERLAAALEQAGTLTVTTSVGGDLAQAAAEAGSVAGARPVAVTRIGLLGDAEVYLPAADPAAASPLDAVTWARHLDQVRAAQEARSALLAATAEAAVGLARLLRPI